VNLRSAPQMREYDAIVRRIAADSPGRILDWGCGHGQVTDLLWRAGLNVTAFEYRPDADEGLEPLERYPHLQVRVSADPRSSYLEAIAKRAGLYYHGALEHDRVYDQRPASALLTRHRFSVQEARRMNMLPLTVPGRFAARGASAVWAANRALSAVPGLNLVATNVELVARAQPGQLQPQPR